MATISRTLASADARSIDKLRALARQLVLDRLQRLQPARLTVDFDGSVLSTQRVAEGSAVGSTRRRKAPAATTRCSARSLRPARSLTSRTGQATSTIPARPRRSCGAAVAHRAAGRAAEARLDSAFFSEALIAALDAVGIEFTISVPFERFVELKGLIERRQRWRWIGATVAYFETDWKPKSWTSPARFVFLRQVVAERARGPMQLDLFIPHELGYEFKVIVTNKTVGPATVLAFHNGRGAQECVFGQLKSQCQADYVPVRQLVGTQLFLLAAVLSHNLGRELQMAALPPERLTTPQHMSLWIFHELQTLRRTLFLRAGRLTRPDGELTLTVSANTDVRDELLHYLDALTPAA